MKIAFAKPELPETGSLAVGVMDGRKLGSHAAQVEKLTKGAVNRAIGASRFKGGPDDHLTLLAPAGVPPESVRLLTREATEFSRLPAVRERLAAAGLEPSSVCGDAFAAQIAREIDANARIARELGLKAE